MKHITKQILGCAGLAAVVGMTAVAYNVPEPVLAADNSVTDTIQVRVVEAGTLIIDHPERGYQTTKPVISVETTFDNASLLTYYLQYVNTESGGYDKIQIHKTNPSATGSSDIFCDEWNICRGIDRFSFDLGELELSFNEYEIIVEAEPTKTEYLTNFSYLPVVFQIITPDDGIGDPSIQIIETSESVNNIQVQVYGENGKALFDGDGITIDQPFDITKIPFGDAGAKEGIYTIVVRGLDANGNIVYRELTVQYHYTPPQTSPTGPNTGFMTAGEMNISRTDFLITSLLIFFGVVGASVYIIRRKR